MIKVYENFRAVFYTPFYLAHALGAYEEEGENVVLATSPTPAETARTVMEGKADMAWGGPMRLLRHHDEDPDCDLVCFCEVVARDPFYLLGRRPRKKFRLKELLKYKLGTVSEVPTPWLCLQDALREAGVDPAAVERLSGPSMAENTQALREGKLDVVQVYEPYAEYLVSEGAGHIWHVPAERGYTAYTSFYTTRKNLAARSSSVLAVTRAMHRTLRWLHAKDASAVAEAVVEFFPDITLNALTGALRRYKENGVWATQPVVRREGFERLKGGLLSGGFISRDIPYEECVSVRFAQRVAAEKHRALKARK
ncbi:MAG: ABC transporter substrate-binding protein [SAR324 cluster bacterium]|nr:ABC transporter substrate-binding protein [SAR324 cluster bacterium]